MPLLCQVPEMIAAVIDIGVTPPKKTSTQRFKPIVELQRWFGLSSNRSAGECSLVTLLGASGFKVSRWLVNKLMKE